MAVYLTGIEHRINKADDETKLVKILDEANKMMLREHQDWRAIFSVRDTELP
jgi:HD superfamily phosphohydrolase YqeK